jgi:hypothetical protein
MSEAPREHQPPPPAPAPAPPPAYQQAAPAFHQAAPPYQQPAPQASPVDVGGRMARLMAGRALWAAEQGWRVVEPRLGWVILTTLLFGVIGVLSVMLVLPRILAGMSQPADPRAAAMPPAPSVEDFLRGQQTYDADLMWESFSDELRENLEGRDITRDTLAERVENERQSGQRYSGYKYIGGVSLPNRQAMYFYAVDVTSAQERGTLSFVFTVGSDGKIISVE